MVDREDIVLNDANSLSTCLIAGMQWGSIDFHRRSLENLNEAMRRTRKLCAVMLDTVGRELIVERGAHLDETGWPIHDSNVSIAPNSKVGPRICVSACMM